MPRIKGAIVQAKLTNWYEVAVALLQQNVQQPSQHKEIRRLFRVNSGRAGRIIALTRQRATQTMCNVRGISGEICPA